VLYRAPLLLAAVAALAFGSAACSSLTKSDEVTIGPEPAPAPKAPPARVEPAHGAPAAAQRKAPDPPAGGGCGN
jgi:hypothetical protein